MHQQNTVIRKVIAIFIVVALLFGPVAQVRAAFPQQEREQLEGLDLDFWDEPDLDVTGVGLHASVGVSGQPFVLYDDGTYHLWYGGDDMMKYTSSTSPGSFPAGVDCTFPAGQVPGFRGAIYIEKVDGTFYMINTGDRKTLQDRTYSNQFALYSSPDGVAWTRHRIVFTHPNVPFGIFRIPTKVNAPHMIKINGVLHLYFQYITGDRTNSIGLATSNGSITDISSLSFTKQPDVLPPSGVPGTFDEKSLFHPWVLEKDGVYYMYYSGGATKVGVATSTDGRNWTRVYSNANGFVGGSQQAVVPNNGRWDFWTGSGAIQYTSHKVLPGFTAPTIASNNISGSALTGVPKRIDFTITNPAPQATDLIKGLEIPQAYIRYTIGNTDGTDLTGPVTSSVFVANPADPTATPVELTPTLEDGKLVFDTSGMTDWTITAPLADGSAYITPTFSVPGSYTITATLMDKYGDPDIVMTNVSGNLFVEQGNRPPVTANDTYTTAEDEALTVAVPGVLANDSDPDGDAMTAELVTSPTHGTVTLAANGGFVYTPIANWHGSDSFTYKAKDAELYSSVATVTITVTPVNDAPVLDPIADATIPEMVAYSFTATATDVDSTNLTFSLVGAPAGAEMTEAGVFTWTPTEAQGPGTFSFTVEVCDDGEPVLCDQKTFAVVVAEVNVAPVLADIADQTIDELATLELTFTATDADLPPQTLTYSLVGEAHGATLDAETGKFSWTPTEAQGPATFSFTVEVCDNGTPSLCAQKSFNAVVNEVNVAPVLADISNQAIDELTTLELTFTATDADLPAQALSFSLVGEAHGATITPAGVFNWTPTEAQGYGVYTFTVKVCDDATPALCDQKSFDVVVAEVNVAPVLAAIGDKTATVGVERTFTATATDEDIPAQTLTFSLFGAPDGASIDGTTGKFTWTPVESQVGGHTFQVCVTDGEAEVCEEITVTVMQGHVNTAPVAVADAYETNEDVALTIVAPGVLANDTDAEDDELTAVLVAEPEHGTLALAADGGFVYTPEADWNGTDTFTYKASDGTLESEDATVTITVNPVNDAPVLDPIADAIIPEMVPYTFTARATDVDSTNLTFSLASAPDGAAIDEASGDFTWTPTEEQGPDEYTFTVKVCDDANPALCDEQEVTLTVTEVNVAPVLADIANQTVEELDTLELTFSATDADLPPQTLSFSLVDEAHGATLDAETGKFSWTPTEAQGPATFSFTVEVCDNGTPSLCAQKSFNAVVNEVNVAPVLADISNQAIDELTTLELTFTATDADLPAQALSFSLVGEAHGATITPAGVFNWTPTEAQGYGVYTFTVKVCDDATPSLCDQKQVKLTVEEVNLAPEIEAIEDQEVTAGEELTFTAVASDPDQPVQTLTFRLEEAPAGASINATTGKFTWTPVESQIGIHEFHVCVTDGQLNACTTVKVTVKQGHVNTPPVAVADTYAVDQDKVLTIAAPGVLANDTDADNDTLTAILVGTTSNGTLTLNADGSFVYTPRDGYYGTDTFTYKANDGEADSNVVTVTITVKKVEPVFPYGMYFPVIVKGH